MGVPRLGSEVRGSATRLRGRFALLFGAPAAVAVAVYACVPADTRPVPASLFLTVGPSSATANGLVTADGWTLAFDRVLVGIGRASISTACVRYSEANYDRVLEVSKRAPQKLSVLYGIGRCDVRFRVNTPSVEALQGEGTTPEDLARMRTRGRDRWVTRGSGIALQVIGSARRGDVVKAFDFVFRSQMRLSQCSLSEDAGALVIAADAGEDEPDAASDFADAGLDGEAPPPPGVGEVLETEGAIVREIRVEAESLFRVDDSASVRFDPYAAADGNGDGKITLDELVQVPIAAIRDGGPFEAGLVTGNDRGQDGGLQGRPVLIESLGDYVYVVLLPRLLRYGPQGRCAASLNIDLGRPDGGGGRGDGGP